MPKNSHVMKNNIYRN